VLADRRRSVAATRAIVVGACLMAALVLALSRLTVPGPSQAAGAGASDGAASPGATDVGANPSPGPSGRPSRAPTATPHCDVTRPDPVFIPPKPFLVTPPGNYQSDWYGSAHLWTMLDRDGEVWGPWLAASPPVLPQKTFWWSADWVVHEELEPAITVTGRRLDASGSFTFGHPGTNASADFGTAMLVGIDIPSYGCWELTARYRRATLSYVVSVVGP
jgi:hypothetical protein